LYTTESGLKVLGRYVGVLVSIALIGIGIPLTVIGITPAIVLVFLGLILFFVSIRRKKAPPGYYAIKKN